MLGLPLKEIRRSPTIRYMQERDYTLLGERYSRLGVDAVVGDRKEDLAKLTLVLGLVPLSAYYEFQEEQKHQLLEAVLSLVTNCYQKHAIAWAVEDPRIALRLGHARQNAKLGINSYLGALIPPAEAEELLEPAVH
jgi:predicted component of type VI protein secretion system